MGNYFPDRLTPLPFIFERVNFLSIFSDRHPIYIKNHGFEMKIMKHVVDFLVKENQHLQNSYKHLFLCGCTFANKV